MYGQARVSAGRSWLRVCISLFIAAVAGWATLLAAEIISLFGALPLFATVIGASLLPSLKVVLDMAALAASGWISGRLGRPRAMQAAVVAALGLALFDLEPYIPLNVGWLLRLAGDAIGDSRYVSSLLTTLTLHVLMLGSFFAGAHFSRPREAPIEFRLDH